MKFVVSKDKQKWQNDKEANYTERQANDVEMR